MSDGHMTQGDVTLLHDTPASLHTLSHTATGALRGTYSTSPTFRSDCADSVHFSPPHRSQSQSTGSWWAGWSPCCCAPPGQIYSPPGSMVLCDKTIALKHVLASDNAWIMCVIFVWHCAKKKERQMSSVFLWKSAKNCLSIDASVYYIR